MPDHSPSSGPQPLPAAPGPAAQRWLLTAGWVLVVAVLVFGFVSRLALSSAVAVPIWSPDSGSYLNPVILHPLLPFSEIRTAGVPALLSLGLHALGQPIGVLILHNCLWLLSAGALTFALATRLRHPLAPLVVVIYLAFVQKNLTFELSMLSEHAARCLFDLQMAWLVWRWRRLRPGDLVGLAVLTFANVLVKPTAITLVPVTLVALAAECLSGGRQRVRRVATLAAVHLGVLAVLLASYAGAYRQRFGYWGISAFGGFNLYAHVGHLTNLDSRLYPEVMRELREFMPLYLSKYANSRTYMGDWLIFGSLKRECERQDFGDRSPRRVIEEFARRQGGPETLTRKEERIFRALALDAIRTHPVRYCRHVARSFARLLVRGMCATYPRPADWSTCVVGWQEGLAAAGAPAGWAPPPGPRAPGAAVQAVSRTLLGISRSLTSGLESVFPPAAITLLLVALWRRPWRKPSRRDTCLLAGLAVLAVASHALLLAFILVSEPPRFAVPVQDLALLALVLLTDASLRPQDQAT